ncbi:MAG TPA: type III pantothenate kinase [Bacteroidales bacterium]|nr:type III pantothenate kinase [Bacteroidales bacterium]
MNLVIDFGNTVTKIAVFSDDELLLCRREEILTLGLLKEVLDEYPELNRAIVSSVTNQSKEFQDYLSNIFDFFLELDHTTPLPIRNLYHTPATLGVDRIADAVGANTIFPEKNVLIIDAGTAITIDLVTSDATFVGGNISPGAAVRARALNRFTNRLPLVNIEGDYNLLGRTTEEALRAGILNGIIFEIRGYIERIGREYSDLQIILTGGDAKYFDKDLNYSIFVDSNLNLTGLNRILDYNAK